LATDFIQMLRRIRHPMEQSFYIYNETVPYYTSLLSIEEIERYIQYSHTVGDCHDIIRDMTKYIDGNKYTIKKNTAYYIHLYNKLEREINRRYFKEVLLYLAEKKGMRVVHKENYKTNSKTFKKEIQIVKETNKEIEINNIIKSDVINDEEYDNINSLIKKEDKLTLEQKNSHKLKTLLNKFKYDNERYKKLSKKNKKQLVEFMMDKNNYEKFMNNSVINTKDADLSKTIERIRHNDIKRRGIKEPHEYKQYYRQHFLIDKMLKLVGFKSIKDKDKYTVDSMNANIETNKKDLIAIINEIMYINNDQTKKDVSIKTVGSILRKFYGFTFDRTSICVKSKKYNAYRLENTINWGILYYPKLIQIKDDFLEYAF